MSILIITTPRTGSTILTKALANIFNYRPIHEPLNPIWKFYRNHKMPHQDFSDVDFDSIDHNSKYVIKGMTHQHPEGTNTFDYYKEFAKKFKHVIILDRRNIEDQAISYATAVVRSKASGRNDFDTPYSSDFKVSKDLVDHKMNFYLNEKPKLELLELELGIGRVWYEDLYAASTKRRIKSIEQAFYGPLGKDYSTYLKYTDPKKRYKRNSEKRNLI